MISRNNMGDNPEECSPCGWTSFQTQTTGIYRSMISEWRLQSKSTGLWQYQTFRHGPILYWTAGWVLHDRNTFFIFFSFRVLLSFWRGHMWWVHLEWQTDWLRAFIIYTMSFIKKKKCKNKTSAASAAWSVALALFHHLNWILLHGL